MKSYESSKETVVYGGAFNPPTLAHQAILQACVDYAEARGADVWLLPSGSRTDKEISTPRETRLAYIGALAGDVMARTIEVGVEVSELDDQELTETYDTVLRLSEAYPGRRFTWVFGADSVATMPEWKGGEWMVDNLSMLLVRRPGSIVAGLGRNAALLDVTTSDVSSTQVRRCMAQNEPVTDLVTPAVESLLRSVAAR